MQKVLRILIFDEHFGKPDRIGRPHKLLPEKPHVRRRIVMLDIVIRRGKHTARSARLIADGDDLLVVENIVAALRHQNFDEQFDDIPACIKLPGVHVLIKPADQVFKNVAHTDTVKRFNAQIEFGKRLDNSIQAAVLFHFVDVLCDFELV